MALGTHKASFYARNRVMIWTVGIAAGVILLASFMSRGDIVPLRVTTAQRGIIRSVISTNGKIEPVHNFEVHELDDARNQTNQLYHTLQSANFELQRAKIALLRTTGELENWIGVSK